MSNSNKGRTVAEPDIPLEKIIEAQKTFPECLLRVTRVNAQNRWQTIFNEHRLETNELQRIDALLDSYTGGGRYRVEAKNPNGVEPIYIVPPFYVHVEGQPRPKPGAGAVTSNVGPGGSPMFPQYPGFPQQPQQQPTGWAAGLAPGQQSGYMAAMPPFQPPWRQNGAPPTTYASDQLAMSHVAELRGELGKLREEAKTERERREQEQRRWEERMAEKEREHQREMAEMRRREEEERRRAEDQRRADERSAMQLQMQQIQQSFQQQMMALQQQPKDDSTMQLLVAMLSSNKDTAATALQQQMAMMQMQSQQAAEQQKLLVTIMTKAGQGDKEYLALVKEMMNQKGPETQAALMNAMLEMQVTAAGALANLVKETMPEEPPIWLQAVMGGLSTVQNVANDMIDESRAKRGASPKYQQQAYQMGPGQQPAQLPAGNVRTVVIDEQGQPVQAGTPVQQPVMQAPPPGADPAVQARLDAAAQKLDQMAALLPEDFRTVEWRTILIQLHAQLPVEHVAHLLTRHLAHLLEFRGLPQALSELPDRPKTSLLNVVGYLPIAADAPEYTRQVIEMTVDFLREEGYVNDPEAPPRHPDGVPTPPADVAVVEHARQTGNGSAHAATGVVVDAPPPMPAEEILPENQKASA